MSKLLSGRPASFHEAQKFEKELGERLAKAVNITENAVKEKHMRSTIIGTWQENGSNTFWACIRKMHISANGIMSWKAMTVIYKLLREGHPKVLKDSAAQKVMLADLSNFWKHSAEGSYGKLSYLYILVILKKLDFHAKYDYIPGTILPNNAEVIKYPTRDPNYFFELAIDIFDQLDSCLDLFDTVSKSLNPYKSNSQIQAVQCRICPFPMLIQECSAFYNLSVEIMYKLHRKLTHEMLSGHRNRFYPMFKRLKKFFFDAGALSYVTALISVPTLPNNPPTFVGTEPKPVEAPKPVKQVEEELTPPRPLNSTPNEDERDKLIEQLRAQIKHLQEMLFNETRKSKEMEDALRLRISELAAEVQELRENADQIAKENNDLQSRLQEEMKLAEQGKPAEEKFHKLKQLYTKLRTEHVQLLRANGDVKKALTTSEKEKKDIEETLAKVQDEADDTSEKLLEAYQTAEATKEALKAAEETIAELKRESDEKQAEMDNLLIEATKAHQETEEKRKFAEETFTGVEKTLNNKVGELEAKLSEISRIKDAEETSRKNAEETIEKLKKESKDKQDELNGLLVGKTQACDETDKKLKAAEQKCSELEETLKQKMADLESKLNEIERIKLEADRSRRAAEEQVEHITKLSHEKHENEKNQREHAELENSRRLLVMAVEESEKIVQVTLNEFDNPKNCGTTCTAEYLVERMSDLLPSLDKTVEGYNSYLHNKKDVGGFISSVAPYAHLLSECIFFGKATSHMAPKEDAEGLVKHCKDGGQTTLELLQTMKNADTDSGKLQGQVEAVKKSIQNILDIGTGLIPKEDESLDSIENAVENEISTTAELVADAVSRIEEMLKNAREAHTGVKLEVNERILDSCNALMKAIRFLILKSKDLQGEIVEEGMGSASAKEFYKRHNRWTEGLISAAKAVGWGAKVLVDAADKVVKEGGKFEELVVASNEIAASTAQLVAASRVKASPRSSKLSALTTASKSVAEATGNVVASAKTGSEMIDDSKTVPDYSKLSLTQTKRLEMDSQVRVLELESQLEKERKRLGELRRTHYQLAGASEGWEEDSK